jgi:hypothetical protein
MFISFSKSPIADRGCTKSTEFVIPSEVPMIFRDEVEESTQRLQNFKEKQQS